MTMAFSSWQAWALLSAAFGALTEAGTTPFLTARNFPVDAKFLLGYTISDSNLI